MSQDMSLADILAEGEDADTHQPFVDKPHIPDYEALCKASPKLRRLFPQYSGIPYVHKPWPAWLYHPTHSPVQVRDEKQAGALGVVWRKCNFEERAQGWPEFRWEYTGEWRSTPYAVGFDPANPGYGKIVVRGNPAAPSPNDMIAAVVSAVMTQVQATQAQQAAAGAPAAPALDPEWAEFQAFKAWKAQQAEVAAAADTAAMQPKPEAPVATNALAGDGGKASGKRRGGALEALKDQLQAIASEDEKS